MTTLEDRIGTMFLASDGKTPLDLFNKVYTFLFVENLVYGIVAIVIVLAILMILFMKRFHTSDKEIENRNIDGNVATERESSLISTRKNSNTKNQISVDETDYSSNIELVAVITAAIMAYMGEDAPADGLVIRSIRKVNRRNHVNNYSA